MKEFFTLARKHSLCAAMTLLTDLAFFLAAAYLLEKVFHHYLFDRVLYTILGDLIDFVPAFLRAEGESSFLALLKPLVLYLAWQVALNLATIVTGLFNTKLSNALEETHHAPDGAGSVSVAPPMPAKSAGFFFALGQDLLMLAVSILWSAALFLLQQYGILSAGIAELAFWLLTPFIYALYNLSYAALPRGITYASMFRLALGHPRRFIPFVYACSVGPFLLLFLLSRIDWTSAAFIILFAVSALFRAAGVIMGTNFALKIISQVKEKIAPPALSLAAKGSIFALALILAVTGAQIMAQADSRLELLRCRYRILDAGLNLPELSSSGSIFEQITGLLSFAAEPSAHLTLEVTNPTERTIFFNTMNFGIYLRKDEIAGTEIEGFVLGAGERTSLRCRAALKSENLMKGFRHILTSGGTPPLEFRGTLLLDTWLGKIPYPLWIAPR